MKMPLTFAAVLFLHIFVVGILLIQPGCKSKPQEPSPDMTTPAAMNAGQTDSTAAQMQRNQSGVHDDFNAGLQPSSEPIPLNAEPKPATSRMRATPTRPSWQYQPGGGIVSAPASPGTATSGILEPIDPSSPMVEPLEPGTPVASGMETYTVQKGDTLWGISRRYDVSVNEIKSINNLNTSTLQPGQALSIPVAPSNQATAPAGAISQQAEGMSAEVGGREYTVQKGDTLSGIASREGTTVSALRAVNNLSGDIIRIGQTLIIPGNSYAPNQATTPAPDNKPTPKGFYRVKTGDTLIKIARQHNVTLQEIMEWNGIRQPQTIRVGQELRVKAPSGSPQPAIAPRQSTAPRAPQAPVLEPIPSDEVDLENLEDIPETTIREE